MIGPIYITQIGFNVTGLPTKAMPNYVIRMGHTASDVENWISSGLTGLEQRLLSAHCYRLEYVHPF